MDFNHQLAIINSYQSKISPYLGFLIGIKNMD
jgi:hypothetical protein